jgi:hypothetical protein
VTHGHLQVINIMRDNTFELFGPLASDIREVLFHEWDPHSSNHNPVSADVYDDYIPAIHRLVKDRRSTEDEEIGNIAGYLNFVVKNYIGKSPDKELNLKVAAKIFALAEGARQRQPQLT